MRGYGLLGHTPRNTSADSPIQAWRLNLAAGLALLPLDRALYTVTAGAAGTDTFLPQVERADGTVVNLTTGPVEWTTSHDATADAIVAAINTNAANHNYIAIKTATTAQFAVYQRRWDADGQEVEFRMVEAGAADGTLVDFPEAGQQDAVPVASGEAVPDTHDYYEIGFDPALLYDLEGEPRMGLLTFAGDAQWSYWKGRFNPNEAGIVVAQDVGAELWTFGPDNRRTGYIITSDYDATYTWLGV